MSITMHDWAHGVFESLRCYRGEFFLLEEHLDRLFASAHSLGWESPYGRKEITQRMKEDFARQKERSVFVRVTLYRDPSTQTAPMGAVFAQDSARRAVKKRTVDMPAGLHWEKEIYDLVTVIIPKKEYPQKYYNEGVTLATVPTRRNSPMAVSPQVKSNNTLGGVFALEETRRGGSLRLGSGQARTAPTQDIFEPLLMNDQGFVTEGTICNFFIVKRNKIITSPVHTGLLEGVTRNHVIDLAREGNFSAEEIPLTRHDIYTADEAFLTNTSMNVMPVRKVDGREIGAGTPGEITKHLMRRLEEEIQTWEKRVDNDQN